MAIPGKIEARLAAGIKRFQPILNAAKSRDVNESDTSMIVADMMADVFGYDKYSEITRELCVRGTYCDLATMVDGKVQMIVEVKAIGLDLKDAHTKQAVDYAANQGIEWVVVTNGAIWRVFRVSFAKPIGQELVLEMNLLEMNPRTESHLESLYLLTRESIVKSALDAYHDHKQATSKFFLAAVILSDSVLEVVRRQLRRVSGGDARLDLDELRAAITTEVVKRDVLEGEKFEAARKKVARSAAKMRIKKDSSTADESVVVVNATSAAQPAKPVVT